MSTKKLYFQKNNLHHAYLIEGERDIIVPEIIESIPNGEICQITVDSFKIDDARNLKSFASEKSFSAGKRIFIISANSLLLEAQNSLLKMFEEPIENTHFFLVVPDINSLLKTLVSRFYLISTRQDLVESKDAEKFIAMPIRARIDFIKELLAEEDGEDEDGNEILVLNSTRSKALKFLNSLEFSLHQKAMLKRDFDIKFFEHFFEVREFLRMPGSSVKSLMESVALIIPNF